MHRHAEQHAAPQRSGVPARGTPPAAPLTTATHVVKTMQAGRPGTARWLQQYGDRLVCVRYREDAEGQERYVTLELLVERRTLRGRRAAGDDNASPAAQPSPRVPEVAVQIAYGEHRERDLAKQHGGRWNPATKLWNMPKQAALALGWRHRIRSE